MKTTRVVKMAALLLAAMLVFVTFQAYWIGQLDLPYAMRSLLAISGGMAVGYAVSFLFIVWIEADNSFE
jgi:hypothetical protein